MKIFFHLVMTFSRKYFPAVFFIGLAAFIYGCEQKIPEEKFVDIYIDLLKQQAISGNDRKLTDSILVKILQKYDVNRSAYTKTLEYYNEDAERWEGFFLKVNEKLSKMRDSTVYERSVQ